jgi:hypothetical protein
MAEGCGGHDDKEEEEGGPHVRAALHRSAFRFGACTLPLPGSEAL